MRRTIWFALLALLAYACDDNTGTLGGGMMPPSDYIEVKTATYEVSTRSLLADSIYLRTTTGYLGRYVDADFGEVEADFMAQLHCPDDLEIETVPDSLLIAHQAYLYLYYQKNGYYGDSLTTNKLSVYELNKDLQSGKDHSYSAVNPADYYDAASGLLGSKFYSLKDLTIKDSLWNTYSEYSIRVRFPDEFANRVMQANREHPEYFRDSESFVQHVFKGVYVKHEMGDHTLLPVTGVSLILFTQIYGTDSIGNIIRREDGTPNLDSMMVKSMALFEATKEVVQSNRFRNAGRLKELTAETKHTYLKTPAGIFTEATLPVDDVFADEHRSDTLNAVRLRFTLYNDVVENQADNYPKPDRVLLLRKADMYSFFEDNELYDDKTSYQAALSDNAYLFSNINTLVQACWSEKQKALADNPDLTDEAFEAAHPDWNKVVLIPVVVSTSTSSSSTTVVDVSHQLGLTSARLEGGPDGARLQMHVTYTSVE